MRNFGSVASEVARFYGRIHYVPPAYMSNSNITHYPFAIRVALMS